jgi:recombinational DNA repair protein RecR
MSDSPAIEELKEALRRLPGVGPKSAQRMALYLLERDRSGAKQIASALVAALERVTLSVVTILPKKSCAIFAVRRGVIAACCALWNHRLT